MALFNDPGGIAFELKPDLDTATKEMFQGRETISILSGDERGKLPQEDAYVLASSLEPRGLFIKSLTLNANAQGFFKRLFHAETTIYLLSWAWHIAADPIVLNPPVGTSPVTLRLRADETERFLGDGTAVFAPPQVVRGGFGVNIQLWQSRQDDRNLGETIRLVQAELQTSKLWSGAGAAAVTLMGHPELVALLPLADALAGAVSAVLKSRGDAVLDTFAGYYTSTGPWGRDEVHEGSGVSLTLGLS